MRLSDSFYQNTLDSTVGGIINKFKIHRRRVTLFFEEPAAVYIKMCELAGYEKEVMHASQVWMALCFTTLMPSQLKILPRTTLFNTIIKRIWSNLGLVGNIHIVKEKNTIKLETKDEGITRIIGKNNFMVGAYMGVLNSLYSSQIECIEAFQSKKQCKYVFRLKNKPFNIKGKPKNIYNQLNHLPQINGLALNDFLKCNLFSLKGKNKIYFRGKSVIPIESTILHLMSNKNLLSNEIPRTTYNFFKKIVKETTNQKKFILLKIFLQAMGWGAVDIIIENSKEIIVEIKYPPCGLQAEPDNWDFLLRTIQGYLWLIDKNFILKDVKVAHKLLVATYSAK